MGDYARVTSRFWTGKTGRALRAMGPSEIVVALYLITCESRSPLGLFYLPIDTIAFETGLGFEGASKALRRVIDSGFCDYDEAEEVVWVPEMAGIQIDQVLAPKDNRAKWVRDLATECRKLPFYNALLGRWGEALRFADIAPSTPKQEAPSKPLTSPFEANPTHPIPNPVQEPHAQPCPVREMPPHVSRTAARVPVAKTDSDLIPLFEAYCRGSGQSLTWRQQHVIPTERLFAENAQPADVERIAKFYRSKLGEGTASYPRFAAEFDKWRAESAVAPSAGKPPPPDNPRLGAPSAASRNIWKSSLPPPTREEIVS